MLNQFKLYILPLIVILLMANCNGHSDECPATQKTEQQVSADPVHHVGMLYTKKNAIAVIDSNSEKSLPVIDSAELVLNLDNYRVHLQREQELKLKIQQQKTELRFSRIVAWIAAALALLSLGFAFYYSRHLRNICHKDHILAEQINKTVENGVKSEVCKEYTEAVYAGRDKPVNLHQLDNSQLSNYIRSVILRERLYLSAQFDRQAAIDYFHLSKERIGAAFSQDRELTNRGYVPYLFRWTVKSSTHKRKEAPKEERTRTPNKRGWHLFYGQKKVQLDTENLSKLQFLTNTSNINMEDAIYQYDIRWLFGNIRKQNNLYKIGFGKRTYKVLSNHRFKFGIAFAPPQQDENQGMPIQSLVTNIALFNILFVVDNKNNTYYIHPSE